MKKYIDLQKLKREWKTFSWAILSILIEGWDTILSSQLGLVDNLIPQQYHYILHIIIPMGFLILHKWKDDHDEGKN